MENAVFTYLCILIACLVDILTGKMSLEVMTKPIIFGKDIKIKCIFPRNTNCEYTRTWTCGPRYEPVVMNGVSSDQSKYQESDHRHCRFSVLTVKQFNESDVDIVYKCTFGFESYEHVLELNRHKFEYHPTERISRRDITVNRNNIYLDFNFKKIFPKPVFQVNIEKDDITSGLVVRNQRNGLFYQTNLSLNYQSKRSGCIKSVKITCKVGTAQLAIADIKYSCNKKDKRLKRPRTKLRVASVGPSSGTDNLHTSTYCFITSIIIYVISVR